MSPVTRTRARTSSGPLSRYSSPIISPRPSRPASSTCPSTRASLATGTQASLAAAPATKRRNEGHPQQHEVDREARRDREAELARRVEVGSRKHGRCGGGDRRRHRCGWHGERRGRLRGTLWHEPQRALLTRRAESYHGAKGAHGHERGQERGDRTRLERSPAFLAERVREVPV